MSKVLIIGATGVLGSATAKDLLQNNFSVKAFVRNQYKAAELEKEGAHIFVGDITKSDTVASACKDVDVIITAAHGMLGTGKNKSRNVDGIGHKNLIDAAVRSGVKHFIYTSLFDVSKDHPIDFIRTKYQTEQYLINSGLNYTILRLPAFMEWHVHNLLGKSIQKKGKTTILGSGNNPANFIAVDDIVRALRKIILNAMYYNKIINIAGPENISRNEIANLYGKYLHVTPRVSHIPISVVKILSRLIGPFHQGIGRVLKFSAYYDKADSTMDVTDSIQQFGLQPTTVRDFVKSQLRASS